MDLVPIKVKIGLRSNGYADHPDWTRLPMINSDAEARQYAPLGWMYDKSSGHGDATTGAGQWDSPLGEQWGCLLVTRAFADEALAVFPMIITELTEAEFQDFYDNRAAAHLPDVAYDVNVLQGLKLEYDLLQINGGNVAAVKARIAKAVDKNDATPGIKANNSKKWADFKIAKGVTIE